MTCFDRYIAVDWSAAARPVTGNDSIWVADRSGSGIVECVNPPTRASAWEYLDAAIDSSTRSGDRLLIGVDVALGYPAGSAHLFGFGGRAPWRSMWSAIASLSHDDADNRNNRFEAAAELNRRVEGPGPFWGCPHARLVPALERTKPIPLPAREYRLVEERLRAGGRRPFSAWQLLGAGSVGGQSLTAIPGWFERLDRVDVWPFTTGFDTEAFDGGIVVAELWPSLFDPVAGPVKDREQVLTATGAIRAADQRGVLGSWLRGPGEHDTGPVLAEEGWILGVM